MILLATISNALPGGGAASLQLAPVDFLILGTYFIFVIGIGWAIRLPEYLKLRFDQKTRTFNALSFAAMTVFSSGISMVALAKLLNAILGWSFDACIFVSGAIVMVYIYTGGLTSAIYNEVLQFFLIVFGFLPLVILVSCNT
jgi:Na+/proline symporter